LSFLPASLGERENAGIAYEDVKPAKSAFPRPRQELLQEPLRSVRRLISENLSCQGDNRQNFGEDDGREAQG
jgi:hypothetical protein